MPVASGAHRKKAYIELFKGYHRVLAAIAETKNQRKKSVQKAHKLASAEHQRHYSSLKKLDKTWKKYEQAKKGASTKRQLRKAEKIRKTYIKKLKTEMRRHGEIKNALGVKETSGEEPDFPFGDTPD